MKKDFYGNPFRLLWYGKRALLQSYLWVFWLLVIALQIIVFSKWPDKIDLTRFSLQSLFTPSLTGLTFTLALFVAEKNIFNREELYRLATYKNDRRKEGSALMELLAPFLFTAILFLITGVTSLLGQFVIWNISVKNVCDRLLVCAFIDVLLLALLSLFGLIVTTLNDAYLSAKRK
ncbi:hypothetical protein ACPT8I_07960 [Lactiplantibacillus plantarum]|uniref:hypothetical protein n=1 Tax=Lactiplantibacillus plantarum TaxID=1590 RepID=UPI0024B91021|nr:hypothetical protein [Lactiplantibacillus plantarum]WHQ55062.1 hypothetical protein M1857_04040 [Lactiplantibacillus plantarum]BEI48155.1 hypothetical protein IYO2065_26590 [Lactiplantibacillus plantarum]